MSTNASPSPQIPVTGSAVTIPRKLSTILQDAACPLTYCDSALYVCNDQSTEICVSPADAVWVTRFGQDVCITDDKGGGFSSQVFTTNQG